MNLTNKNKTSADGKVTNEFNKEQASEEALARGLFAGGSPGSDPVVVGTTEVLGVSVPAPSDWGEGDGANIESLVTELGGAISGGNCCAPASLFKMQISTLKWMRYINCTSAFKLIYFNQISTKGMKMNITKIVDFFSLVGGD